MEFGSAGRAEAGEIAAFFAAVFAAAADEGEGRLVGRLARDLVLMEPEEDRVVLTCREGTRLVGCIILSRLVFPKDPRAVVLLSPVGVATDRQGQGLGQALLRHGLALMRERGVDVVMTYGDPAYYGRVGFRPVTADAVAPPQPLRQPHGWQGLALGAGGDVMMTGPSRAVAALERPELW
jgi:putative acetyltransferase